MRRRCSWAGRTIQCRATARSASNFTRSGASRRVRVSCPPLRCALLTRIAAHRQGLQRTCKSQLDIHNARRRRAYAAASKKAARVGARSSAAARPQSAAAAPRRARKPAGASATAPRPATAVSVDVFSAALGNSLGALLLPALIAMSQPQLAPPIPPPPPPMPVLQALGSLGSLGNEDVLRACLSGLLQHAMQAPQPPPPLQPPMGMELVRILLNAQQAQHQSTAHAAAGGAAASVQQGWRTG